MPRPTRILYADALYHVTARGSRRGAIFNDDEDRELLLNILGKQLEDHDAQAFAYCLMGNHYHFVLRTRRPNLSDLMRRVSGAYTYLFNRRHGGSGHLFDGRFTSIVVDAQAYLLKVCRYVELNPVRAGLAPTAAAWRWSSHAANAGREPPPSWLSTDVLHGILLGRDVAGPDDREEAGRRHDRLIEEEREDDLWRRGLRERDFLGDAAFVARVRATLVA